MKLQANRPYLYPLTPSTNSGKTRDGLYVPKGYYYHLHEVRVISKGVVLSDIKIRVNAISKSLQSMTVGVPVTNLSMQDKNGGQITSVCDIDLMLCDADVLMVEVEGNNAEHQTKICFVGNLIPNDSKVGGL